MPTHSDAPDWCGVLRAPVLIVQGFLQCGAIGFGLASHAGLIDWYHPAYLQPLCVALFCSYLWALFSWRVLSGYVFDPYNIFLSAAYIFNAGQAFLQAFGLNPQGIMNGQFPPSVVMNALLLVGFSLLSMHSGALLCAAIRKTDPEERPSAPIPGSPTFLDMKIVGWCLLMVAFPAVCLNLVTAIQRVMVVGYLGLYSQEQDVGVNAVPMILGAFLVPAALNVLAGSEKSFWGRAISLSFLLIYCLGQLFLGFRYYGIMPLVIYGWVWHRCIRPLPLVPIAIGGVILAIVVFPTIRTLRQTKGESRSLEGLVNTWSEVDDAETSTLREMGGTVMVTMNTMEMVPDRFDYDYGKSYGYALLTLVPNLFWDLHPSIAYGTRSRWLINSTDPWVASKGGSIGFSFIAEAYLAFGWAGAPWVMALGGFAFARFVLWSNSRQGLWQARIAAHGTFITYFAFFARDESALMLRPLVWYALLPYLAIWILARVRLLIAAQPSLQRERA